MASSHKAEPSGDETVFAGRRDNNTRGHGGRGGRGRGRGRGGRGGSKRGDKQWFEGPDNGGVRIDSNAEASRVHRGRGSRGSMGRGGRTGQCPNRRGDPMQFTSLRNNRNIVGPSVDPVIHERALAPIDENIIHDHKPASLSVRRSEQCLPQKTTHPRLRQANPHPQTLHRTSIDIENPQSRHSQVSRHRRRYSRKMTNNSIPPHLRKSVKIDPITPDKLVPPHLRSKKPKAPKSLAPHLRNKAGSASNSKTEHTESSNCGVPLNNVTTPPPSTGRVQRGIWVSKWVEDTPESSPTNVTGQQQSQHEQHSTSAKADTSVFSEPQHDDTSARMQDTTGTSPAVLHNDEPEVVKSHTSEPHDAHDPMPAQETPATPSLVIPSPMPQTTVPHLSFQQWNKQMQLRPKQPYVKPTPKPNPKPNPKPKYDRASRWPKNSEMRVRSHKSGDDDFNPAAWKWDDADGVPLDTNSNDPIRLTDWEGNWLPAPIEWEGRKGYRHANFYQFMSGWRNQIVAYSSKADGGFDMNIPEEEFVDAENETIAPRHWVPLKIEDQSPQTFWTAFQMARPQPIWEEDLAYKPWWLTYMDVDSPFILPPIDKEEKGVNPNEPQDNPTFGKNAIEALKLKHDADDEKAAKKNIRKEQKKKQMAQNMAELAVIQEPVKKALAERELKPEVNLYIRPVKQSDMPQITEIYNWHQNNSILPPEGPPVSLHNMSARMHDIVDDNCFPFIVAVEKTGSKRARPGQFALQERIAGFAYVDDYHSVNGMYRYSCELEMFVRHDLRNQAVGSCLLDKLIAILDPFYDQRNGYEWKCDVADITSYERGGRRMMGKVLVQLAYFDGDMDLLARVSEWLDRFHFKQSGNIEKIGCKFRQFLGLATFVYTTGYMSEGVLKSNLHD